MSIKLNNKIDMDLLKFRDGKLLLQANTGGGKSWAMRRILEQSFNKIPQIILDTEGEFSTLRQKYDYILIGKGHDITADHKTAALLAHRLIKERVSAIIDLFEMQPREREMFVENFVSAMTNAPRNLWLPTLLVIDEAQTYAPEGDKTECGRTIHDAAFKFRKRHFGLIFATPRIAALSKNVISTCKNKLIGYTSLENDVKRAAYELGFGSKEEWRSLRDLEPGEFFAFGPAISREIIKLKIGEVATAHGDEKDVATKVLTPSAKVKKALAALADLPQAAEEEARTILEFKKENVQLKRELTIAKQQQPKTDPKETARAIEAALHKQEEEFWKQREEWLRHMETLFKVIQEIGKTAAAVKMPDLKKNKKHTLIFSGQPLAKIDYQPNKIVPISESLSDNSIRGSALKMLELLAKNYPMKFTKPQWGLMCDMSHSGGSFNTYLSVLRNKNVIIQQGDYFMATEEGLNYLGIVPTPPTNTKEMFDMWSNILKGKAREIFNFIYDQVNLRTGIPKDDLALAVNMSDRGGSFNTYLSILRSNNLIRHEHGLISLNQEMFNV